MFIKFLTIRIPYKIREREERGVLIAYQFERSGLELLMIRRRWIPAISEKLGMAISINRSTASKKERKKGEREREGRNGKERDAEISYRWNRINTPQVPNSYGG